MAAIAGKNVQVQIFSITGSLVSTFQNNTDSGADLVVECTELRDGGLDSFSFTVPADTSEPLFIDMECKIFVDSVHWYSGFANKIPNSDSIDPVIEVSGNGFIHKLKEKTINVSYTSQTLDYIIKDIANTNLGVDINVYYNIAKIAVPTVTGISIKFEDNDLQSVFTTLLKIANKDYATTQYTFGVDENKELYFSEVSNDPQEHFYEGFHYQNPTVENLSDRIVNKILTYRTTLADSAVTEYVATYEDTDSQGINGLYQKKLTFPNYADTTTISNIANSIIEKYTNPLDRLKIKDLPISTKLDSGFYQLSNRRKSYFISVNELEDLSQWDTTNLSTTTAVVDGTNVLTGRKSLKLTTAIGSVDEYLEFTLDTPIRFPELFRAFVYLADTNGEITILVSDTDNNTISLDFGNEGDLSGAWIKRLSKISTILDTGELLVDNGTGDENLIVDYSVSLSDIMIVDTTIGDGIFDVKKVRIIINNNNAATIYVDALSVKAKNYLYRKLIREQISYTLGKSYTADLTFGEKPESLIDEIQDQVSDGNIALSVFSKQ